MRTNLITERKKRKLTQAEVAKIIGKTIRHYSALEAGTSKGSVDVWEQLRDLFHKSIDYLLEQVEQPTKKE